MSRQFEDFKKIICEFNFDNTYKAAWAKALIELSSELPIAEEETRITISQIAQKYMRYYWDLLIRNDLPQSSNSQKPPEVVTTIKNLINVYYDCIDDQTPDYFRNAEAIIPKGQLEAALKKVTSTLKKDVSYRFLMLNRQETDVYSYTKGDDSLWLSSSLHREIRDDKQHLLNLVHYRWGKIMDLFGGELETKRETVIVDENNIDGETLLEYEKMLGLEKMSVPKRKIKRVIAVRKGSYLSIFQLERHVREHKSIGRLLINAYAKEEEFDDIHVQAIKELRKGLNSFYGTQIDKEIVFVSLTIIALQTYDGSFYEHVEDVYGELFEEYGKQRVEALIRDTLRALSPSEEYEVSRLINTVIKNTLVPLPFLGNYFEFCFDIYEKNFDHNVPDNLVPELKDVFEGIREATATEGDGLTLGGGVNKSYKLIRTTKQIISESKDLDDLVWLTGRIIAIIDRYYWNGKANTPNNYFRKGLNDWAKKYELAKENKQKDEKSWRSQWTSQFALSNDKKVVLRTPPHKIKKSYNWETIRIFVFNGTQLIKECEELDIRQVLGYYQIQPQEIVIDNPLGHVIYKVIAESEELYSSQERLKRDVLVFDEFGNEIGNHTDYEGAAYICTTLDDIGKSIKKSEHYNLIEKRVVPGDYFHFGENGENIFLFSDDLKPTLIGEKVDGCFAVQKNSKKKETVYRGVEVLKFEMDSSASPVITVNNRELSLDSLDVECMELVGKTRWTIHVNLSTAGKYDIALFYWLNGQKKTLNNWSFCLDPIFGWSYKESESGPYGRVEITSSFFDKSPKAYLVSFESFDEEQLGFTLNGKQWYWLLPEDFPVYRIDGGSWKSISSNYLWIEDLTTDSKIEMYHACRYITPRTPSTMELEDVAVKDYSNKEWPYVDVGFLLNYKDRHDYIDLFFMGDNYEIINELRCYNKICIDKQRTRMELNSISKSLTVEPVVIGKGELTIEVKREDTVIKTTKFSEDNSVRTFTIPDIQSFVPYIISFYQEKRQLLGLRKELVGTIEKRFFFETDFLNRDFPIVSVEYEKISSGRARKADCLLNNTVLSFDDYEDGIYKGTLSYKTRYGEERKLDNINPVFIEILSEIYGDTIDLAIVKPDEDSGSTKENYRRGDGLLLKLPFDDFHKGEILNSMDDNTAPDILTYHMTV